MARPPRSLTVDETKEGYYHVFNRVAGSPRFFSFRKPRARRHFIRRFLFHLRGSYCRIASLVLMDNHFHAVLQTQPFRRLSREKLQHHARHYYGHRWKIYTANWSDQHWLNFNRRLFSLSRLMQVFESEYACWYNRTFQRRGAFWAERFKANRLDTLEAVRECIFYNELNPPRAGLAKRPEEWKFGSAYWRWIGQERDLIPLSELFPETPPQRCFQHYRALLLYRGLQASKENQATLPEWILRQEEARGFRRPVAGVYLERWRFFLDGLVVGAVEGIQETLDTARLKGFYRRRCHPIPQLDAFFFSLREQRSHARLL